MGGHGQRGVTSDDEEEEGEEVSRSLDTTLDEGGCCQITFCSISHFVDSVIICYCVQYQLQYSSWI